MDFVDGRLPGIAWSLMMVGACAPPPAPKTTAGPAPTHFLSRDQTHNRFSRSISPVIRVPSGAVIQADTREVTDNQLTPTSTSEALRTLKFDPIHPLTGPVYVEGAEPGDVLQVKVHRIEIGDWGWAAVTPGFGFLASEFKEPFLKIFRFAPGDSLIRFNDRISIPARPFAGVMGVAPATDSMLVTIPPRGNGGNMDNRYLVAGTTVYFPILVPGALFSIGDAHVAQGDGEVGGTGIESPMRIVYQVDVRKGGRRIEEPQYETNDFYAVGAHGTTLEAAAKQATRYMIDYLVAEHGLSRPEAYILCSIAGNLRVTEVVDMPNYWVAMHMPKRVLGRAPGA